MKVVLATSPHLKHGSVLQNDFRPHPEMMYTFAPVGLLSLAAMVRRDRPRVACSLYDLNARIRSGSLPLDGRLYEAIAGEIAAETPEAVGFMTECDSYHHVLQVAAAVKRAAPECKFVLGGPHASTVARETLEAYACIDAVIVGEGEVTFIDWLDSVAESASRPVAGALIRAPDGTIVEGPPRPLIANLDELPIPAYGMHSPAEGEEIFIEVGRGCPFQCQFCSTAPYWHRRHRVKAPARIVAEVELVTRLFGAKRVHFTHDLFTTNRKWVERVCAALIQAGAPVRWTCSARTDTVDDSLLLLMKNAGCDAIYFGIESGSPRILANIKKEISLEQSFGAISKCVALGITPNVGFIVGFPTEDASSLEDTLAAFEHTLRLGSRPAHIFTFNPFNGAPMFSQIGERECNGHFVDIPLGTRADAANRALVKSDPILFASYFRPKLSDLIPGAKGALEALDEFSPLVEAVLSPTLELAALRGGMYAVFVRWLRFVETASRAARKPKERHYYGTARLFAAFVASELRAFLPAAARAHAAAQFIEINLRIGGELTAGAPTSFARYRSIETPIESGSPCLHMNAPLEPAGVLATLHSPFDVAALLRGASPQHMAEKPSFLVWQRTPEGGVRLVEVDQSVHAAIVLASQTACSVADVLMAELRNDPLTDVSVFTDSIAAGVSAGLLRVRA